MENKDWYKIVIPLEAVSTNQMYDRQNRTGYQILSDKARQFKKDVQTYLMCHKVKMQGDLAVSIQFYMPSRRNDLDNLYKAFEDACQGFLYENDRQIRKHINCGVNKDRDNVRIEIELWRLDKWSFEVKPIQIS